MTFAFAGDTQFVDIQDTETGAVSTGLPLLGDRVKADPGHVLAPLAPVLSGAKFMGAELIGLVGGQVEQSEAAVRAGQLP